MNWVTPGLDELVELEPEANPVRFHAEGGSFNHYGPVIHAGGSGAGVGNVTAHELNHYWLHSSTPYGVVLDELGELACRQTIVYCVSLYKAGERIPIPAIDVARADRDGALSIPSQALIRSLVRTQVVPWTHDVLLENWFEGMDLGSVRNADLATILRWLIDYEDRSRAIRSDEELFIDSPPPFSDYQRRFVLSWAKLLDGQMHPAFPVIGSTEARPFGGQHLFEASAQLVEHVDEAFWAGATRSIANLYWGLFALFVKRYPSTVDSEDGFRSVVSTFMAIVDLALFTPVGRVYGRLRDDSMNWLDLHPGWRLEQILDVLQPDDWLEGDDDGRRLQSRLSMRLVWPPPDRFLELGSRLAPATHDLARHAAACRLRLDADDRMIVDAWFNPERLLPLLKEHYPVFIRESGTQRGGADIKTRLQPLMSYSVASFAWMVMRNGALDWPALFPPGLDFGTFFDNVHSYDDLIDMYRGGAPFYSDDAFCAASELLST